MMPGSVRLGVVLLCHADLDIAARMARIWAEGGAQVCIHIDANVRDRHVELMRVALADLKRVAFSARRHRCKWGAFSLVRATQDTAAQLLADHPDLTHVYLASGACLPLRPVRDLIAFLAADPERDHIESVSAWDVGWTVGGLNEERFTLYFPFDWRRRRWLFDRCVVWQRRRGIHRRLPPGLSPHLGSQWWCLTATTLRAILDDPDRPRHDRFFRYSWIPDESYFQTLARRHSVQIESRSLTLARFDQEGLPFQLYDDHVQMLEESNCFVARRLWSGSAGLLARFPRRGEGAPDVSPPRPARFERMITRTVQRRVLGRPGLYMQSRFPRKDAENGKTSAPYAVFQGFSDIFPNFESWLQDQVAADVHGHLLGPETVEFRGRPGIGPGAISSHVAVRDRDPQGFLTALIRIAPRMQIFQFGPRDNQALNWFMATDPNACLFVVTGAWMMPLIDCAMPFDDVRRISAHLQKVELAQLNVLNSVWVKARVQVHDLTDFLARPRAILDDALRQVDPQHRGLPAGDLPPVRDTTGLPALLRRLRNSGLRPRLAGEALPQNEVATGERNAAE